MTKKIAKDNTEAIRYNGYVNPRFTYRLRPELRQGLEKLAEAQGTTLSDQVTLAIEKYLDDNQI